MGRGHWQVDVYLEGSSSRKVRCGGEGQVSRGAEVLKRKQVSGCKVVRRTPKRRRGRGGGATAMPRSESVCGYYNAGIGEVGVTDL